MACLPVLVYGDPRLRLVSREVRPDEWTPEFQISLNDLIETMYASDGIGLAAPQVGDPRRVLVIDTNWVEGGERRPEIFINPVVEVVGPPCDYEEGCLSVPGLTGKVIRPSVIHVSWLDRDGQPCRKEFLEGMQARCLQHEMDHLQGVLFVDHLSPAARTLASGKLRRLARGGASSRLA